MSSVACCQEYSQPRLISKPTSSDDDVVMKLKPIRFTSTTSQFTDDVQDSVVVRCSTSTSH
ncbi:unnamed protein product [Lathyrus sativus]|nr:unnamed protein product [Lathyrus sativus]